MKIVDLQKGNTAVAAEYIQKAVGGDLFEIETVKTYKQDHFEMIEEAKQELKKGVRVEIKGLPKNWESYDTIFLCFPNWWNDLPMPVVTFAEGLDWAGKCVIPFCTSEGSGLGKTATRVRQLCTGAAVTDGFHVLGSQVKNSAQSIAEQAKAQL